MCQTKRCTCELIDWVEAMSDAELRLELSSRMREPHCDTAEMHVLLHEACWRFLTVKED